MSPTRRNQQATKTTTKAAKKATATKATATKAKTTKTKAPGKAKTPPATTTKTTAAPAPTTTTTTVAAPTTKAKATRKSKATTAKAAKATTAKAKSTTKKARSTTAKEKPPTTTKSKATKKGKTTEANATSTTTTTITRNNHYTHPGIEAAVRLSSMTYDIDVWETIVQRYNDMLRIKGGTNLIHLNGIYQQIRESLLLSKMGEENQNQNNNNNKCSIKKVDLMNIIHWKFARGQPTYSLMTFLESNQDDTIMECSCKAFTIADSIVANAASDPAFTLTNQMNLIRQSIDALCELKGVGATTASAILSLYKPELYVYMDEEIMEILIDGKRANTSLIYVAVNEKCRILANHLNENNNNNNQLSSYNNSGYNNNNNNNNNSNDNNNDNSNHYWTPCRVGQALWTASKLASAPNEVDYTLKTESMTIGDDDTNNKKHGTETMHYYSSQTGNTIEQQQQQATTITNDYHHRPVSLTNKKKRINRDAWTKDTDRLKSIPLNTKYQLLADYPTTLKIASNLGDDAIKKRFENRFHPREIIFDSKKKQWIVRFLS